MLQGSCLTQVKWIQVALHVGFLLQRKHEPQPFKPSFTLRGQMIKTQVCRAMWLATATVTGRVRESKGDDYIGQFMICLLHLAAYKNTSLHLLESCASACWADQGKEGEGAACKAEAKIVGSRITEGGDFKSRHMAHVRLLHLSLSLSFSPRSFKKHH